MAHDLALEIDNSGLVEFGREAMIRYGSEVNEERALPDYRDGLKPVHRRLLWASYKLGLAHNKPPVKSARIVGETIGKYSPHGDMATYGALAAMVLLAEPLIDGSSSNFGSMIDPPAAPRYTEARPTKYTDSIFFNPEYLAVSDYHPNYDESTEEPVILPALLPNLLVNGSFGIGYGTTCSIPAFERESIVKLLSKSKLTEITPELCASILIPKSPFGGVADWEDPMTKEEKSDYLQLMKTGEGNIPWAYTSEESGRKAALVTGFPPVLNVMKAVEKIMDMPGIISVEDKSCKKTNTVRFLVTARDADSLEDGLSYFLADTSVKTRVTERIAYVDERTKIPSYKVKFFQSSITDILVRWVEWRKELEIKRLQWLISKANSKVEEIDLLLLAIKHKDSIPKMLESADPIKFLQKLLKVEEEQAKYIANLRLISLTRMNADKLRQSKKEEEESVREWAHLKKVPEVAILESIKQWG